MGAVGAEMESVWVPLVDDEARIMGCHMLTERFLTATKRRQDGTATDEEAEFPSPIQRAAGRSTIAECSELSNQLMCIKHPCFVACSRTD